MFFHGSGPGQETATTHPQTTAASWTSLASANEI